jgi:glutamate racemase
MIGVYDSGVGGLTILNRIRGLLPDGDLLYLADQANLPYGDRTLDQVRHLAVDAVQLLIGWGATTVVVACNTASAAALTQLRERFERWSIVGMEPAVKPAADSTRSGVIGVLATAPTFEASRFVDLVGRFADGVEVIALACPGWAAAVEEQWPDGASEAIRGHLQPLLDTGVDTIVLGCTHYSFLADVIATVAGDGVNVVDPADAVARQTARVADASGSGSTRYLTTGDPARLAAQIERLAGDVVEVESAGSASM